jgi:hypothetical protein
MPEYNTRSLRHIYLPGHGDRESFTSPLTPRSQDAIPERDRAYHAAALDRALTEALAAADAQINARNANIAGGSQGFYLEFELPASQAPLLDKLEDRRGKQHIELVSVHPGQAEDKIAATVFVPAAKRDNFLKKVQDYRTKQSASGKPKNELLVASVDTVRLAHARSLYTDAPELFPVAAQNTWWEVWLRPGARATFEHAARALDAVVRPHFVSFAERDVVLALAPPESIGSIVANTDAIAELRLARDTPAAFMEMTPDEQIAWTEDTAARIVAPPDDSPAVCLLDSGTTRNHPLIHPALAPADQQSWDGGANIEDTGTPGYGGHGTEMSGIALYGDLVPVLNGNDRVELAHRLESVKILPDNSGNDPDLYGHITATAISRAEINAPQRPRAVCLAVTAGGDHWRGRPSSWSATLDDLAYGNGSDQRLIVVSAGNIRETIPAKEYLDRNDVSPIESPAQAWNAVTVGACTEKVNIVSTDYNDWQPMGAAGDLSPRSRTSVSWQQEWPIKPDLVLEGGNLGVDPAYGHGDDIDDLALLTTFRRPKERAFTTTGDTSAATAQIARMAAQILADRPDLWPETVRALLVHSAEWTQAMRNHLPAMPQNGKRTLIRRYGYGVPDLTRAIRSLSNDVTMIIEGTVQPYDGSGGTIRTRDMILHDLPWPSEALEALGQQLVQMKVTLSYFIEPNPGERGWTKRHRYSSHGLRFAVKRSEETVESFRRRINRDARDDDESHAATGGDAGWFFGQRLRNRGSLHSDIWEGTAADLASRHAIAIYPTGGWWREKPALQRADRQVRYALIVSLRAPVHVDIYTPIEATVGIPVDVEV